MTIKCADSAGFCFGVKRAVDTVYDLLAKENHKVYTLGPIIHNEQVVEDLASQGVQVIEHPDEIAKEDRSQAILVIRSHGVPESVIHTLKEEKIPFEDATCPFVVKKDMKLLSSVRQNIRRCKGFSGGQKTVEPS